MTMQRRFVLHATVAVLITAAALSTTVPTALADESEFDAIAKHLKVKYQAKRISIPFLGLAKFFVKVVRPAGVKSFKVAIFEDLKPTADDSGAEFGAHLRNVLSADWLPIVRMRSSQGQQMHVYGKADGENIKLMVLKIDKTDAVVARVKLSPSKLREFLDNPRILGISIN